MGVAHGDLMFRGVFTFKGLSVAEMTYHTI
jgi:hypothetical protein